MHKYMSQSRCAKRKAYHYTSGSLPRGFPQTVDSFFVNQHVEVNTCPLSVQYSNHYLPLQTWWSG